MNEQAYNIRVKVLHPEHLHHARAEMKREIAAHLLEIIPPNKHVSIKYEIIEPEYWQFEQSAHLIYSNPPEIKARIEYSVIPVRQVFFAKLNDTPVASYGVSLRESTMREIVRELARRMSTKWRKHIKQVDRDKELF